MKAAIYVRVSTEKQTEKYGLDAQKRILTDFCKQKGWDYEIYEDAGISGETIDARPEMIKLLEDARAKKFDVALAIEFERFSRSEDLFDWLLIKKTFRENGILLATPNQSFNLADEEDDFISDLFGALSKREKKKILARMNRGRAEAARKGKWTGGQLPFGYKVNRETKELEIDEEEAETVKLIFRLCVEEGMGSRTIADRLNGLGILPKVAKDHKKSKKYSTTRKWRLCVVLGILHNPIYIGERHYNKKAQIEPRERRKPVHELSSTRRTSIRLKSSYKFKDKSEWVLSPTPPIISKRLFEQAQAQIKRNTKYSGRAQIYSYLLKGIIVCGECGRNYYGFKQHEERNYRCMGKRADYPHEEKCTNPNVKAEEIESVVWGAVKGAIENEDYLRSVAEKYLGLQNKEDSSLEKQLKELDRKIEAKKLAKDNLIQLHIKAEELDLELFDSQMRAIKEEEQELLKHRALVESWLHGGREAESKLKKLEELLERARENINGFTETEKYEFLKVVDLRVVLNRDRTLDIMGAVPLFDSQEHRVTCDCRGVAQFG